MSDHRQFSRRGFLKGLGVAAGAAVGTRIAGKEWEQEARAATAEPTTVISVFLNGGYNALFGSADSFQGNSFGVTGGNIISLGNNLVVDSVFQPIIGGANGNGLNPSQTFWRSRLVSMGNRHGSTDHGTAQRNNFTDGATSLPLQLAAAIGGDASFKAVALGDMPAGPNGAVDGVSMQRLQNVSDAQTILTGGQPNFNVPARNVAAEALTRANTMSGAAIERNKESLVTFKDGYATQIDALRKPVQRVDVGAIRQAYGNTNENAGFGGGLGGMNAKMAAAEMLMRAGANFIYLRDNGRDTTATGTEAPFGT